MVDPGTPPARTRRLSQSDWLLLETLDTRCQRPLHTGRFLTMHKRRRKRLTTRSLTHDTALLDDIHHGQVQCVLERVNQWPFNAFILDNVTGGRSLPVLCVHLFHWYGLLDHFRLDPVRCWKFFSLIEEGYHSTNPYHNSIHATDVTQAMHCFLQEKKIREHLTPLEIMASLIAAVTHDLDHPGVNQPFLVATSNHLAALYEEHGECLLQSVPWNYLPQKNTSVLENHHWRSAIGCLLESHVAEQIEDCRPELQRQISSLILATDITRQQEFLTRFKRYLDQDLLDMRRPEDRHFILQIALKCADISNPCRPWDVSKKWSQKVCEEFFRQGDYERQLNLPVTALCDRQSTSVPKIQTGFLKFVVYPLFEEWHRFLGAGLSDDMMRNLHGNQTKWEALVLADAAEETKTETSEVEPLDETLTEEGRSVVSGEQARRRSFLAIPELHQRVGRRHSVPLSIPSPPGITRTILRRESLALGEQRLPHQFQSGLLEEEEDLMHQGHSSLSLLSTSSGAELSSHSAENLLPEPSIASITPEAPRLSSVMQGAKSPLTRQQTFPPPQPYVRQRYMSATTEMDKSTSSGSSRSEGERGGILRESNRKGEGGKRETEAAGREKGFKVAKLGWDEDTGEGGKENVEPLDPCGFKSSNARRNTAQGLLSRRRGSAPVGLLHRDEVVCPAALALRGCSDRNDRFSSRRGSVPIDVTRQNYGFETDAENNIRLTSEPNCYPRRGSAPGEPAETKPRSCRKKLLRRRSSGGPEMFLCFTDERWRRETHRREAPGPPAPPGTPPGPASRRRGSLPIDVLLATHSGDNRETQDS